MLGDSPVDDIRLHSMKDLPRHFDSGDHCTQPFVEKDHIGSCPRRVRSALDGDSTIGLLETRGIVHSVACHGR